MYELKFIMSLITDNVRVLFDPLGCAYQSIISANGKFCYHLGAIKLNFDYTVTYCNNNQKEIGRIYTILWNRVEAKTAV